MSRIPTAVRALVAAAGVALMASPALAQQVIDFHELRAPYTTDYQATPGGDVYSSNGYGFFAAFGSGALNTLSTWGTAPDERPDLAANVPRNLGPTAASLFAYQFGERLDMFREQDDFLFNLYSIDLAAEYAQSYLLTGSLAPFTVTFYGFNSQGINTSSLIQTFTVPVASSTGNDIPPELHTYTFNDNFRNLSQVAWFQGNGSVASHQFTNVNVETVTPEPGTYLLVGSGLVGIMLVTVRRRLV
jgi:hypothetical protein